MIAIIIISFILEGVLTNIINTNSIILPLFTIVSLVITYPYIKNNYTFIIISIIIGLLYDIAYTNSLFINTFTFTLCSLLIIFIDKFIKESFFGRMCINIFMIIIFKILSYFLLFVFSFIKFNHNILIKGIISSLILNIIYGLILYFICDRISIKLNIRKKE